MTAKSTKSKTNRKKTGTTSKKSTSNKKTTKKNTKKTTRSTRTAKSDNSFLMDEILIWITLAVSIILLISNPSQAFGGFMMIIQGGFTDGMQGFGQVLYMATPLIMTGLSVGFAFKTGLFNIGASGQFTAGAFAAVYVGVKFTFLPPGVHCLAALQCK